MDASATTQAAWMTTSDVLSLLALIVSVIAATLEVHRWFTDGPKIALSVMPNAKFFGGLGDDQTYYGLSITNRGNAATMVTHIVVFEYANWWKKWRRRHETAGVVMRPAHMELPYTLEVNKYALSTIPHSEKLEIARKAGRLYVGCICSHSDRNFLIKVPSEKNKDIPQNEIDG